MSGDEGGGELELVLREQVWASGYLMEDRNTTGRKIVASMTISICIEPERCRFLLFLRS